MVYKTAATLSGHRKKLGYLRLANALVFFLPSSSRSNLLRRKVYKTAATLSGHRKKLGYLREILRGTFGRFFEKKLRKKLIKKGNFIYQYQINAKTNVYHQCLHP